MHFVVKMMASENSLDLHASARGVIYNIGVNVWNSWNFFCKKGVVNRSIEIVGIQVLLCTGMATAPSFPTSSSATYNSTSCLQIFLLFYGRDLIWVQLRCIPAASSCPPQLYQSPIPSGDLCILDSLVEAGRKS